MIDGPSHGRSRIGVPLRTPGPRAAWLWLLIGLFTLRVAAQPTALVVTHRLLPPFESWHSGTMPYPLLLASQLVILAAMAWTARRIGAGTLRARPRVGVFMTVFGAVYLGSMLIRLLLGVTVLQGSRWFSSWLPTLFHLVLATFVLLVGRYHVTMSAEAFPPENR